MKRKADANLATRDGDLVGRALATETEASSADGMPDPRRWLALTVMLVAACMDMLDVSIVNVGIPSIQSGLSANYAAVEWVLAGYTLAFAAGLITGGRIGDLYGRKRMFLLGTA
ncbi:MAG TPA: MFS transporter, partial [Trebonia sp.]|nr:MFS transporter [Trebonia sp.]